jgi:hypothetical protein
MLRLNLFPEALEKRERNRIGAQKFRDNNPGYYEARIRKRAPRDPVQAAERRSEIRNDPERSAALSAQNRAYRRANPQVYRSAHLKAKFGLTIEQFERMNESQKGLCAICGRPETAMTRGLKQRSSPILTVDHDHDNGRVRGLLCGACNRGIGLLGESRERLRSAIDYLTRTAG